MESVAIAGILVYILVLITVFVVGILGTVFWIWMLVDCATKERGEGNDKLIWVLIILFTHIIGAALYYFVRRPKRKAELGV
jgi:hypothetical protein